MKSFALVATLATAASALQFSHEHIKSEFDSFIGKFEKTYADQHEYFTRLAIFSKNYVKSKELNLELNKGDLNGSLVAYGVTQFSDMTIDEMRKYTNYKPSARANDKFPAAGVAPKLTGFGSDFDYDWREQNMVSDVLNQGQCGSCWAFSAAFGVESAWAMKNGGISPNMHFSTQQLVDCDRRSSGCNGGDLPPAFDYLTKNGMALEETYPYTATDGLCRYKDSMKFVDVKGYDWVVPPCDGSRGNPSVDCDKQDEEQMVLQIALNGPAAVCVAVPDTWFMYTGPAPFTDSCKHHYYSLNHCVGLVGWKPSSDIEGADGYWIMRNSWGTKWGIDGYMLLPSSFTQGSRFNNFCGISSEAAFAVIE